MGTKNGAKITDVPASRSAESFTGTGTARFWSNIKGNHSTNYVVSQACAAGDLAVDGNTYTWNTKEGTRRFIYTIRDAYGMTLSVVTDKGFLLDHTPPQVSVSVDLAGTLVPNGSRSGSLSWTESSATDGSDQTMERPETAWSNKMHPKIKISCKTNYLDQSETEYNNMKEIRLYKTWKDSSGTDRVALLAKWKDTDHATYDIPPGSEDVLAGDDLGPDDGAKSDGTGTYFIVAIDDLCRRTVSDAICPEPVDTTALYRLFRNL